MKNLVRSWLKGLNEYSDAITAFSTLALVIFALVTHIDTSKIINQDEYSQQIQSRAYLSVISDIFTANDPLKNSEFPYKLNYTIKNDGKTPAEDVSIYLLYVNGVGSSTTLYNGSINSVLGPGEITEGHDDISIYGLNKIPYGGKSYLQLKITYKDYNGFQHFYTLNGQAGLVVNGILTDPVLHTIESDQDHNNGKKEESKVSLYEDVWSKLTSPAAINTLGLTFDILGAVLLFCFGLPEEISRSGKSYLLLQTDDEEEKSKAAIYDIYGRIGLAFLVLGFVLQTVSNFL